MEKLPLSGLEVFYAIAENGSLRSAAAALGVQPPTITHHLQNLEEELGVSLVTRTTRSAQLTDAGQLLAKRLKPCIYDMSDALNEARILGKTAKGKIRVTLPYHAYSFFISHWLTEFQQLHPEIELEFSLNEAFVDILAESFHAGIRVGGQISEEMVAVKLTDSLPVHCIGSKSYFDQNGRPETPKDLLAHNCIRYRYISSRRIADWKFHEGKREYTVDVRGNLILNSTRSIVDAINEGAGIGQLYYLEVKDRIDSGEFEIVLNDYAMESNGFYIYYPKSYAKLVALKIFVDFIRNRAQSVTPF